MSLLKILILAIVQGLAELLPVSSSAHVVTAEKLMGLDPSSPEMTLLLVMLHTGTMFAVIVYFWKQWMRTYFSSANAFSRFAVRAVWATALTGIIGYPLQKVIEHALLKEAPPTGACAIYQKPDLELLFSRLDLVAYALFAVGLVILWAGLKERTAEKAVKADYERLSRTGENVTFAQAGWIGGVQGLSLPFRGFSRSGSTISAGMLVGAARERAERFSFALAVILTPAVVAREGMRLHRAMQAGLVGCGPVIDIHAGLMGALIGMVLAFFAGLAGLKWLSSWLESGKWYLFGIYCLLASCVVLFLHHMGK